jgi:hypothetical protein
MKGIDKLIFGFLFGISFPVSLAMFEKTIGLELQKMFGLGFEVTRGMIIAIILTGGLTLIVTQYYLTKRVIINTLQKK